MANSTPASAGVRRSNVIRNIVVAINLALGLLLWFLYWTDYSLVGTVADYCFPPAVALVSLMSLMLKGKGATRRARRLYKLACAPSLIGGGLAVLMAIILIPLLALSFMFEIDEFQNEALIQRAVSPDGRRVAYVYFRPVGAYSGGNGNVLVRVRHRFVPLLERDVWHRTASYADESTHDYLRWEDADTLHMSEGRTQEERKVKVGIVGFRTPRFVAELIWLITFDSQEFSLPETPSGPGNRLSE